MVPEKQDQVSLLTFVLVFVDQFADPVAAWEAEGGGNATMIAGRGGGVVASADAR